MKINNLILTQFRNHHKCTFEFNQTTIIVGKNTAGKTNVLEALSILTHGKSFRAEHDADVIEEKKDYLRVEAKVSDDEDHKKLVVIMAKRGSYLSKKFMVNNVARRHVEFASHFPSVLFTPQDIEIITASPSLRRRYIDSILYQSSKQYRVSHTSYEKALRQRNRMLNDMKNERKYYKTADFAYWDNLLIEHGGYITNKREEFVSYINTAVKKLFDFTLFYDKSLMSHERLFKYHFEEQRAGVTLVGPQRDDFFFYFPDTTKKVSEFGSRGQERLTILQMKLLEIEYIHEQTQKSPTLLLDDIFSELDSENIDKIYHFIENQQTIITTTHKEFVPKEILKRQSLQIITL